MCGRFTMAIDSEDLRTELALGQMPPDWEKRYNIAPSQDVATVPDPDNRDVVWMRWGLVPFWAKDPSIGNKMINARAETVAEKPSFRNSFKNKRCLILANGFYEWRKSGGQSIPFYFQLKGGEPFAFAGLWDDWENKGVSSMPGLPGLTTCTLITTSANEDVRAVHPRMPVVLTKETMWDWLEEDDPKILESLLKPLPAGSLIAYQVSRDVNSPQNQGEYLVEPIEEGLPGIV
ncbi:MAG TPA: SOS response-associated peptidase [Anaerolineaceae bacterium]|nr:SOS response-associated peptidase [Anaerolineaceae bacterium]